MSDTHNNDNSNSVIPKLPDIKIIEKVSLKMSESISDKYSDKDINSDSDIPKLSNIKMESGQIDTPDIKSFDSKMNNFSSGHLRVCFPMNPNCQILQFLF